MFRILEKGNALPVFSVLIVKYDKGLKSVVYMENAKLKQNKTVFQDWVPRLSKIRV